MAGPDILHDPAWELKIEQLKVELSTCADRTKAYLGPILKLEPVKQLLVSFLNDDSKSVEDWIWDPQTQRVLNQLKERLPDIEVAKAQGMFFEALSLHQAGRDLARTKADEEADDLINEAQSVKAEAKEKFVDRNFFGAMKSYNRAADVLSGHTFASEEHKARAKQLALECRCNAAVCAWKSEEMHDVKASATKALEVDERCVKALYWRARANEKLQLYDNALRDIKRAMEYGGSDAPPEVLTWHDRVKVQVSRMDEARQRLNELRLMRDEEKRSRGEVVFSDSDGDDSDDSSSDEEDTSGMSEAEIQYRRIMRARERARRERRRDRQEQRESGHDMVYLMPRPPDMDLEEKLATHYVWLYMFQFKYMATLKQDVREVSAQPPRFEHTMTLPPYVEVSAVDSSHKRAKQRCALVFLKKCQEVYREQHQGKDEQGNPIPEEPAGWAETKARLDAWVNALDARAKGIDRPLQPQEFIDYADAWLAAVAKGLVPSGRFVSTLSTDERRAIHARVSKHGLKSTSVGDGENRQLFVFLKDAAARAERSGYVEVPPAPIMPSPEVLDSLPTLEQPPEPPKPPTPPPVEKREEDGRRPHRGGRRHRGRRRYRHDDDDRYTTALVPPPPEDEEGEEEEGEGQAGGDEGAGGEEAEAVELPPAIHPTVPEPAPEPESAPAPAVPPGDFGPAPGVTQEFITYCECWLEAIVDGTVPAGRFPTMLTNVQRKAIHHRVGKHGLKSNSIGPPDARQLVVFMKNAVKRASRRGCVDIPLPPTTPSPSLIASLPTYKLPVTEPQPDPHTGETEGITASEVKPSAASGGRTATQGGGKEQAEQAAEAPSEAMPLPQEFVDYVDAWLQAVTDGQVPAGRFASTLSAEERKAIHARVGKHGLKSQSVGPADSRQLSVFLKDATARAGRHGYVQIPPPPTTPSPNLLSSIAIVSETRGPAAKGEAPVTVTSAAATNVKAQEAGGAGVGPSASPN